MQTTTYHFFNQNMPFSKITGNLNALPNSVTFVLCVKVTAARPSSDPNCLPSVECCSCQPLMDVLNSTGSLMALGTDMCEHLQSIQSDVVFFLTYESIIALRSEQFLKM